MLCSRSLKPGPIHGLPVELLYNFLEPLDYDSIRACTLVCREWRMVSQRLLYKAPRLSGYESLDPFFEIVTNNPHLGDAARDLHILGKANYSSMRPTPWILDVPSRLVTLLPNVRSITFVPSSCVFTSSYRCETNRTAVLEGGDRLDVGSEGNRGHRRHHRQRGELL